MSDAGKVMKRFQKEIDEILDIIEDEIKKSNGEEAAQWLGQLLDMKEMWQGRRDRARQGSHTASG